MLTGTLPELLAATAFLAAFEEFLRLTSAQGGGGSVDAALLEFWKDIQVYKKASERLLSGQARGIHNKYFGHGTKYTVNLDKKLLADLKVSPYSLLLFSVLYISYSLFYCCF